MARRGAFLAILILFAGCKTRLFEMDGGSDGGTGDGGAPDISMPVPIDLSLADFAQDFSIIPDLSPPPDLTRPKFCNGIFVFDTDNSLWFFDPVKLQFLNPVPLNCAPGWSPFSMSVGRDGTAWVEYTRAQMPSRLYKVNTDTGACQMTNFMNPGGSFASFGMGFAADGMMAMTETLYLAGDAQGNLQQTLGSLDLQNLIIKPIGPLPGRAELTGTGSGELWAFFADANSHMGRVDKMTGQVNPDFPLPQLGNLTSAAFAFGFFGGDFYAFVAPNQQSTTVWRITPDGKPNVALANTGRHVVGAGVSTCAPIGMDQ